MTMIKKYLYLIFTSLITFSVFEQDKNEKESVSFDSIISGFQSTLGWYPLSGQKNDSVTCSSLFRTDNFNVSISENPIHFDTNHRILRNYFLKIVSFRISENEKNEIFGSSN